MAINFKLNHLNLLVAALAGFSLAITFGGAWAFMAIPAYFCLFGIELFQQKLPAPLKPFGPFLAVIATLALAIFITYVCASFLPSAQAPAQANPASTATGVNPNQDPTTPPTAQQVLNPDAEAANLVYAQFIGELNKRKVGDKNLDQVQWLKAMRGCLDQRGTDTLLDAQAMESLAACADKEVQQDAAGKQ